MRKNVKSIISSFHDLQFYDLVFNHFLTFMILLNLEKNNKQDLLQPSRGGLEVERSLQKRRDI